MEVGKVSQLLSVLIASTADCTCIYGSHTLPFIKHAQLIYVTFFVIVPHLHSWPAVNLLCQSVHVQFHHGSYLENKTSTVQRLTIFSNDKINKIIKLLNFTVLWTLLQFRGSFARWTKFLDLFLSRRIEEQTITSINQGWLPKWIIWNRASILYNIPPELTKGWINVQFKLGSFLLFVRCDIFSITDIESDILLLISSQGDKLPWVGLPFHSWVDIRVMLFLHTR